jgi:hypothetical protein
VSAGERPVREKRRAERGEGGGCHALRRGSRGAPGERSCLVYKTLSS